MNRNFSGRSLSHEEMRSIQDVQSEINGTPAPCSIALQCANGKIVKCSTSVEGEKCSYVSVQVGSSDFVKIAVVCGITVHNCNDSEEGGSGGQKPEEPDPNPNPEPVIPPGSGSGGEGGGSSDPSVSAERGRKL